MSASTSGWASPEPEPPKEEVDWDLYLGPAAWRPFNRGLLDGFNFEKGGGMVGGGVLEWGSHCVDLCQWAADADGTAPVEYNPPENGQLVARYANGVKLVLRNDGWLPLGSCPVRFEGDTGWVEAGDSGKMVLSSPALLAGRKVAEIGGYPATFHVPRFPGLRQVAREAALQRRRRLLVAHHLPCRQHRDLPGPQAPVRRERSTSLSATNRPTVCGRKRSANRGGCRTRHVRPLRTHLRLTATQRGAREAAYVRWERP